MTMNEVVDDDMVVSGYCTNFHFSNPLTSSARIYERRSIFEEHTHFRGHHMHHDDNDNDDDADGNSSRCMLTIKSSPWICTEPWVPFSKNELSFHERQRSHRSKQGRRARRIRYIRDDMSIHPLQYLTKRK